MLQIITHPLLFIKQLEKSDTITIDVLAEVSYLKNWGVSCFLYQFPTYIVELLRALHHVFLKMF